MGIQARKRAGAGAKPSTKPAKRQASESSTPSWVVAVVALAVVAGLYVTLSSDDPAVPHAEPAVGARGGNEQPDIRTKKEATKAAKLAAAAAAEKAAQRPPTAEEYSSCFAEMHLDQANRVDLVYWPGFHLGCIENPESTQPTRLTVALKNRTLSIDIDLDTKYGIDGVRARLRAALASGRHRESTDDTVVSSVFGWKPHSWGLYNSDGWPIESISQLQTATGLYIFEGGQFLWPGIKVGYERKLQVLDREILLTTMSLRPLVIKMSGFLSTKESEYVMKRAHGQLKRSGVVSMDGDDGSGQQARTSTNTALARGGSPTIYALESRAHQLTRLPYDLGEEIQVVRYTGGQKYEAHRDFFHPNDYVNQPSILDWVDCGARNRVATVFWYLNTVKGKGGETYFPRALNSDGVEYKPWNYDFRDCYRGVAVKPVQGDAVLFYSMLPNGELDERSLHGGCPPENETKWGANQWIWNVKDGPNAPCKQTQKGAQLPCRDFNTGCSAWAKAGDCDSADATAQTTVQQLCPLSCGVCT